MMKWRDLRKAYIDRIEELSHQTPSQLLEVSEDASPQEVRRAYLAKVRAYHPDSADPFVKAHSEEVLKLINRAYETLTREVGRG
jgi:DnaJ-class molecular chaperone